MKARTYYRVVALVWLLVSVFVLAVMASAYVNLDDEALIRCVPLLPLQIGAIVYLVLCLVAFRAIAKAEGKNPK